MEVAVAVGRWLDWSVAARLLAACGHRVGYQQVCHSTAELDGNLPAYSRAAARGPWLVLYELTATESCAPAVIASVLVQPPPWLALRIAVRATEAWLIGDRAGLSSALKIAPKRLPAAPERELDPVALLVDLARHSRSRIIQQQLVPARGARMPVGTRYGVFLAEFVLHRWDPRAAAAVCPSLAKCLDVLRGWPT